MKPSKLKVAPRLISVLCTYNGLLDFWPARVLAKFLPVLQARSHKALAESTHAVAFMQRIGWQNCKSSGGIMDQLHSCIVTAHRQHWELSLAIKNRLSSFWRKGACSMVYLCGDSAPRGGPVGVGLGCDLIEVVL